MDPKYLDPDTVETTEKLLEESPDVRVARDKTNNLKHQSQFEGDIDIGRKFEKAGYLSTGALGVAGASVDPVIGAMAAGIGLGPLIYGKMSEKEGLNGLKEVKEAYEDRGLDVDLDTYEPL